MAKDVFHVVPQGDQWAVKREGNERASSTHGTQKEAIENAQEFARDGDDIVIHRTDGTIRGRLSYSEDSAGNKNGSRADREEAKLQDLASVGSRVSWGAVLAGAVVAVAVYATLMTLAMAIGITAREQLLNMPRTYVITAAVVALVSLLAALFLGGLVASRSTAGETKLEAIIYGLLVWGTLFVFAMISTANVATNVAIGFGQVAMAERAADQGSGLTNAQIESLALTEEQKKELKQSQNLRNKSNVLGLTEEQISRLKLTSEQEQKLQNVLEDTREIDPATAAWMGFGSMVLSIIAAIAGAIVGAGPELVVKEFRSRRRLMVTRVAVANGAEKARA